MTQNKFGCAARAYSNKCTFLDLLFISGVMSICTEKWLKLLDLCVASNVLSIFKATKV